MDQLTNDLGPGRFSGEGFLGTDQRPPERIIAEDERELADLGITAPALAERLKELTVAALSALGGEISTGGLRLRSVEGFGWLACPFHDPGLHSKAVLWATHAETGETLAWSALSVHLAACHGFLGGRGSPFRLEPAAIKRLLFS